MLDKKYFNHRLLVTEKDLQAFAEQNLKQSVFRQFQLRMRWFNLEFNSLLQSNVPRKGLINEEELENDICEVIPELTNEMLEGFDEQDLLQQKIDTILQKERILASLVLEGININGLSASNSLYANFIALGIRDIGYGLREEIHPRFQNLLSDDLMVKVAKVLIGNKDVLPSKDFYNRLEGLFRLISKRIYPNNGPYKTFSDLKAKVIEKLEDTAFKDFEATFGTGFERLLQETLINPLVKKINSFDSILELWLQEKRPYDEYFLPADIQEKAHPELHKLIIAPITTALYPIEEDELNSFKATYKNPYLKIAEGYTRLQTAVFFTNLNYFQGNSVRKEKDYQGYAQQIEQDQKEKQKMAPKFTQSPKQVIQVPNTNVTTPITPPPFKKTNPPVIDTQEKTEVIPKKPTIISNKVEKRPVLPKKQIIAPKTLESLKLKGLDLLKQTFVQLLLQKKAKVLPSKEDIQNKVNEVYASMANIDKQTEFVTKMYSSVLVLWTGNTKENLEEFLNIVPQLREQKQKLDDEVQQITEYSNYAQNLYTKLTNISSGSFLATELNPKSTLGLALQQVSGGEFLTEDVIQSINNIPEEILAVKQEFFTVTQALTGEHLSQANNVLNQIRQITSEEKVNTAKRQLEAIQIQSNPQTVIRSQGSVLTKPALSTALKNISFSDNTEVIEVAKNMYLSPYQFNLVKLLGLIITKRTDKRSAGGISRLDLVRYFKAAYPKTKISQILNNGDKRSQNLAQEYLYQEMAKMSDQFLGKPIEMNRGVPYNVRENSSKIAIYYNSEKSPPYKIILTKKAYVILNKLPKALHPSGKEVQNILAQKALYDEKKAMQKSRYKK